MHHRRMRIDSRVARREAGVLLDREKQRGTACPPDRRVPVALGEVEKRDLAGKVSGRVPDQVPAGRVPAELGIVLPSAAIEQCARRPSIGRLAGRERGHAGKEYAAIDFGFGCFGKGLRVERHSEKQDCQYNRASHRSHLNRLCWLAPFRYVITGAARFSILLTCAAALWLLLAPAAWAQFTLVNGTITDPNGVAYACATITATLVNNSGISPKLNGLPFNGFTSPVKLGCPIDPTTSRTAGLFQMQLPDNTLIACPTAANPAAACAPQTQWTFLVNTSGTPPPLGSGPQTCTATLTISGASQNISASFVCPALAGSGVGSGTVTSVGLVSPPQFGVSGSPVTSVGNLAFGWNPVANNLFLAGGASQTLQGVIDGNPTPQTGNLVAGVVTEKGFTGQTLVGGHDQVFMLAALDGSNGQNIAFTGWGSINITGSQGSGALFEQQFSSVITPPVVATSNAGNASANFAGGMFAVQTPASLTFVNGSGGSVTNTQLSVSSGGASTGNLVIISFVGQTTAGPTANTGVATDNCGNVYTQVLFTTATSGTRTTGAAWVSPNSLCGGTISATVTIGGGTTTLSGIQAITFWSGATAPLSSLPDFRAITLSDLPNTATHPVQSFNQTTLGSNVTVGSTATTVLAQAVTMPASGCPCRVFVSYSLYLDFDSFTNVKNWNFWVNDGTAGATHTMASIQTGQSNAATGADTMAAASAFSAVTYANNAAVTFTLFGQGPAANVTAVAAPSQGAGTNSYLQVVVMPSN